MCEELETQRTRDITKIILNFAQDDKEVWSQFQLVPWLSINVHLLKGPAMEPISPYDNVSIASSLEATSHQSPIRPRAPSWHTRYHLSTWSYEDYRKNTWAPDHMKITEKTPEHLIICRLQNITSCLQYRDTRTARSVEELDKRISSFSNTSGCSDCTTSTLQVENYLRKHKTNTCYLRLQSSPRVRSLMTRTSSLSPS